MFTKKSVYISHNYFVQERHLHVSMEHWIEVNFVAIWIVKLILGWPLFGNFVFLYIFWSICFAVRVFSKLRVRDPSCNCFVICSMNGQGKFFGSSYKATFGYKRYSRTITCPSSLLIRIKPSNSYTWLSYRVTVNKHVLFINGKNSKYHSILWSILGFGLRNRIRIRIDMMIDSYTLCNYI